MLLTNLFIYRSTGVHPFILNTKILTFQGNSFYPTNPIKFTQLLKRNHRAVPHKTVSCHCQQLKCYLLFFLFLMFFLSVSVFLSEACSQFTHFFQLKEQDLFSLLQKLPHSPPPKCDYKYVLYSHSQLIIFYSRK